MSTSIIASEANRQGVSLSHRSNDEPAKYPPSQTPKRVEHIEFTHRSSNMERNTTSREVRKSPSPRAYQDPEPEHSRETPDADSAHEVLLSIQKRTSQEAQLEPYEPQEQDTEMTAPTDERQDYVAHNYSNYDDKRQRQMSVDEIENETNEAREPSHDMEEPQHDLVRSLDVDEHTHEIVRSLDMNQDHPHEIVRSLDMDVKNAVLGHIQQTDAARAAEASSDAPRLHESHDPESSQAPVPAKKPRKPRTPKSDKSDPHVHTFDSKVPTLDNPDGTPAVPKKMPKIYPPRKQRFRPALPEPYSLTMRTDSALSTLASAAVAIKNHQGAISSFSIENHQDEFPEGGASGSNPTDLTPAPGGADSDSSSKGKVAVRSDLAGYRCDLCPGERFGRVHDLKRHQISKHNEMTWPCDFCHRPFVRRDALLRHYTVKAARKDGVHPTEDEVDRLAEAKARAKLLS
ncbi:hypothetical protein CPB97_009475 [Podila verticillata]|nr:hypothetical protein CPB97_009475 [Podila verticillata]